MKNLMTHSCVQYFLIFIGFRVEEQLFLVVPGVGTCVGIVNDNSCLGLESIWVYKLHEKRLSAAWKNLIFRLPIKRAGKVCHQWPRYMYRADQQSVGNRS